MNSSIKAYFRVDLLLALGLFFAAFSLSLLAFLRAPAAEGLVSIFGQFVARDIPAGEVWAWSLGEGATGVPRSLSRDLLPALFAGFTGQSLIEAQGLVALALFPLGVAGIYLLCLMLSGSVFLSLLGSSLYSLLASLSITASDSLWTVSLLPFGLFLCLRKRVLDWLALAVVCYLLLMFSYDVVWLLLVLVTLSFGERLDGQQRAAFYSLAGMFALFLCLYWIAGALFGNGSSLLFPLQAQYVEAAVSSSTHALHSPNFHRNKLLLLAFGLLFALNLLKRNKVPWVIVMLNAVSLLAVLWFERFQILFAAALSLLLVCALSEQAADPKKWFSGKKHWYGPWILYACVLSIAALAAPMLASEPGESSPCAEAAVELLKREPSLAERLFHEVDVAPLLLSQGLKTFVDRRVEFFGERTRKLAATGSFLKDYGELMGLKEGWLQVVEHWNFSAALVDGDSALGSVLLERLQWRAHEGLQCKQYQLLLPGTRPQDNQAPEN